MLKELDFLEFNENDNTKYPNVWDTIKALLKGHFIALSAFSKKLESSNLTAHMKALEQKEVNTPKSRWPEIVKLRAKATK